MERADYQLDCDLCDGTGVDEDGYECPECDGTGFDGCVACGCTFALDQMTGVVTCGCGEPER
jgi:hypothetical protein